MLCLLLGVAIESVQLFIGRSFSRGDIINNIIGGYLGLLTLALFSQQTSLKTKSIAMTLALIFLAVGLRGLEKHLYDEYLIRQQFPLLSGFESKLEMQRWEHDNTLLRRSQEFVKSGQHSLKVDFLPGRYPNISLEHFRNNWSGYKQLVFSIYNPGKETYTFQMKVYDFKNIQNSRRYNDRFNTHITIAPGWNTIKTPLTDIIKAPKHRSMNIYQIKGFSVFTDKLKQPVTLYIDDIHLQ